MIAIGICMINNPPVAVHIIYQRAVAFRPPTIRCTICMQDGNSQDWRYINVRRTMIFLEQSVKNAARAYVFEPNDANTWINMKCMIENFLRSVWKRGGLAGSTPEEAYEVHVGLGDTMTNDDILEGTMRITVLVAVTRPAEFIEITFQQQAQKS